MSRRSKNPFHRVVVSSEDYQRIQAMLHDEGNIVEDLIGMLDQLAPEDWEESSDCAKNGA